MNTEQHEDTLEFSPIYLLTVLLKPFMFNPILQLLVDKIFVLFKQQHPRVIEKLSAFAPTSLLLKPIDLPISFLLNIREINIHMYVIESGSDIQCDAVIKAPFATFIQMLEGKIDGDAFFFARNLSIEGCSEIIVALRNIIESEDISLDKDIKNIFGILSPVLTVIAKISQGIIDSIYEDFRLIKSSIIEQIQQDIQSQDVEFEGIIEKITNLEKKVEKISTSTISLKQKISKIVFANE